MLKRIGVIVGALALMTACGGSGGGGGGGSTQMKFSANVQSAIVTGVAGQSGTITASINSFDFYAFVQKLLGIGNAVAQSSGNRVQQNIAVGDFISIDGGGNVARIFNYSFPIYAIKATTNHLIVSGAFVSPMASFDTPLIVDKFGRALKCYLYAIKKTAASGDDDIICLSDVPVGSYSITEHGTNAHYAHLGFDVRTCLRSSE